MPATMTIPRTRQGVRNLDAVKGPIIPFSGGSAPRPAPGINVSETERFLSATGGSMLALVGLSRGSLAGLALACVGASLMCRGISGHCQLYKALGVNTAEGGNLSPNAELVHQPRHS